MRLKCLALALAALSWAIPGAAFADPPAVVASIKPIYSLIAGVMAGVGKPVLIVHGAASPHTYALRPSDARALDAAQLAFWVGPSMESFLAKPLPALAGRAEIVELDRAPGIHTLPARIGGVWEPDLDAPAPAGPGTVDGHLWLDIDNAKAIVRLAAERLSALDPGNAASYAANARDLESRLDALDRELRADFMPVAGKPFVVFHDAYQYLERRYALTAVGAISVDPDRQPGARRIEEIRAKIKATGAACVFGEPQFTPALLNTVTAGTGAHAGTLDDLGTDIPDGPELYFRLMRGVARALTDCLGP
ncbi:MAG TPA: zinc ABC transporter substrate-binding protein [Stellaceae bacterium]|nr:zinc ABC transporter substrate-binding protein [Stellaceae bacterium]